ncbi:hypothetical protein HDU98_004534, partial [Podochytrium sp. JEL0797]
GTNFIRANVFAASAAAKRAGVATTPEGRMAATLAQGPKTQTPTGPTGAWANTTNTQHKEHTPTHTQNAEFIELREELQNLRNTVHRQHEESASKSSARAGTKRAKGGESEEDEDAMEIDFEEEMKKRDRAREEFTKSLQQKMAAFEKGIMEKVDARLEALEKRAEETQRQVTEMEQRMTEASVKNFAGIESFVKQSIESVMESTRTLITGLSERITTSTHLRGAAERE